ncbi:hypothetical protein FRC16_009453 [Serendipita sp. 398]|nr:hypothetical protein FRC16_009453 [Serendipita sp. 398]
MFICVPKREKKVGVKYGSIVVAQTKPTLALHIREFAVRAAPPELDELLELARPELDERELDDELDERELDDELDGRADEVELEAREEEELETRAEEDETGVEPHVMGLGPGIV